MGNASATASVIVSLVLSTASALADVAEPDVFPEGTDLGNAFEGISISVDGNPTATVLSLDGTFLSGPSGGTNIASTGSRVFGHDITGSSINEQDFFRNWDGGLPNITPRTVLRVDFDFPTDSVSIDMLADDDDEFLLQAFASDDTLLETVNLGVFAMTARTFSVERTSPDIAYILASGVAGEGGGLDNLQFRRCLPASDGALRCGATPVSIDIKPGSDPNCFNINGHGVIPVAILGETTLDVTTIDVDSLLFGGLQLRQRKGRALCSVEDVNDDARWDLVCKFDDVLENWVADEDTATLTGQLYDGTSIEGTDSICLTPKKGKT